VRDTERESVRGKFNFHNNSLNDMADTLTELSQRNEAFWIGLALFLLGVITPETLLLGGIELSRVLIWIGGGILMVRVLVGIYRILRTTAKAGVFGYREGKQNDR
jgi:uncharacterized membrane protein